MPAGSKIVLGINVSSKIVFGSEFLKGSFWLYIKE